MIEKTIISPLQQKNNLLDLKNFFVQHSKGKNALMTEFEHDNTYVLAIALPQENINFEKLLKKKIVLFFVQNFKRDFFKKRLKPQVADKVLQSVFVNALVRLNQHVDFLEILNRLQNFEVLNLNSFFHFKLQTTKKRWEEILDLTNKNLSKFETPQKFEALLKFLISSLDTIVPQLNIFVCPELTTIYDNKGTLLQSKKIKSKNAHLWLLKKLVDFAPTSVTVQKIEKDFKLHYISKLFDTNVCL